MVADMPEEAQKVKMTLERPKMFKKRKDRSPHEFEMVNAMAGNMQMDGLYAIMQRSRPQSASDC